MALTPRSPVDSRPGRAPASAARRRADPGPSAKRREATILSRCAATKRWTPDHAMALRATRSGVREVIVRYPPCAPGICGPAPDVDAGEQEQPHDVDEVPIPGG